MADKKLSRYKEKRDFTKTAEPCGRHGRSGRRAAAFRHPEARRLPAALRPAAGARWRLQILGRHQGALARPARPPPRRRSRGSSAGLRRLRGHDSERPVWRRHRAVVGSRLLGAARARRRKRPGQGRPQIHPGGREAARQLGAGAHAPRPQRRQAHQLAADQAPGRVRRRGNRRRHLGRGPLRRLGPHHGRDRGRQRPRAEAFHARRQGAHGGRRRSGIRNRGQPRKRASRRAKATAAAPSPSHGASGSRVRCRNSSPPQLCKLVDRPPAGAGLGA